MRIERVLLLVHRGAAGGHAVSEVSSLAWALRRALPLEIAVEAEAANGHEAVKAAARAFASEYSGPSAIIAGGGGGTLRAVVEAVIECGAAGRVRIAALRFGSGNVVARRLRVPTDPALAIERIASALLQDTVVPSRAMRIETGSSVHHAVSLAAFGQVGRVAADVARVRALVPRTFRALSRAFGIEQVNQAQYASCYLGRTIEAVLDEETMPLVEIKNGSHQHRTRLLSAVAMRMPIPGIPIAPGVDLDSDAIAVALAPWQGRTKALHALVSDGALEAQLEHHRLGPGDRLEIALCDRPSSPFFLDEDPLELEGRLTLSVAERISLIPAA